MGTLQKAMGGDARFLTTRSVSAEDADRDNVLLCSGRTWTQQHLQCPKVAKCMCVGTVHMAQKAVEPCLGRKLQMGQSHCPCNQGILSRWRRDDYVHQTTDNTQVCP
jgi:hypothetical protein